MTYLLRVYHRVVSGVEKGPVEWLLFLFLLPFSVVYGMVVRVRNKLYDWQVSPSCRSTVPVVSVGNLVVGGTGKTPVVDWLVKEFTKDGKKVAVISRGYGGTFRGEIGIVSDGETGPSLDPFEVGDEPFLLARRNPRTIVLIARKRVDGVRVAENQFGVDVIILDDGFQHRAVKRDVDIVLLDAAKPYGNGWLLPAGMLREPTSSLSRASIILKTRAPQIDGLSESEKSVFFCRHAFTGNAVDLSGNIVDLQSLKGLKVCAFAGIANPDGFFYSLEEVGLEVCSRLPLGDHCHYSSTLIDRINTLARDCDALVTTEKDAVKLISTSFQVPCYQIPMSIQIDQEKILKNDIVQKLWREK